MGKASSAKKVARAARAGGSQRRDRPKLAYPLSVFAVIVLGALLVVFARTEHNDTAGAEVAPSYLNKDHWHAAYGVYVCDHYLAPMTDVSGDKAGIHTHGEGVIHIHPFVAASSGTRAKMKVFADDVGLKFSDDGFKMPDGTEYRNGEYKCGDKPAKVAVYKSMAQDDTVPTEVFDSNFNNILLAPNGTSFTIAVLPEDFQGQPPKPDSAANLAQLGAADIAGSDSTTPSSGGGATDPSTGLPPGVTDPNASVPTDPNASTSVPAPAGATPSSSTPTPSTP
jgi:hypothetical protein